MAMEEKIQMGSHKLTLQNRGSVMLTGVKDVVAFDENQVVLDTELGLLTIKGKNLHMNRLTLEKVSWLEHLLCKQGVNGSNPLFSTMPY